MSKTVLITGCSSGIGRATAGVFATHEWNVVATMRAPTKDAPWASAPNVLVTRLDVEDRGSIDAAVEAGLARFGAIDALVNNAGYGQMGIFEAISPEKVRKQFDVNVFGVMDVTRRVLPHMREKKSGVIVNVSSGVGIFGLPLLSLYSASKFALEGFSEALAFELASQGIVVKSVVPHGVVTETRFGEHANESRAGMAEIADYQAFVEATGAAYGRMGDARNFSAVEVAEVIFAATTDGTDRLRYLVGDDTRGFVRARRELSDEDYVAFVRGKFRG